MSEGDQTDVTDLGSENENRAAQESSPAGWYDEPGGVGRRFYDGREWTEARSPVPPSNDDITKTLLWGLSLGFGATGAVGIVAIPILAFYFPLGFGIAGIVLAIVAGTSSGTGPKWAWLAVAASVAALIAGASAYSDFNDASNQAQDVLDSFGR